jgi:chromosome segregation ATPase
MKLPKIPTNYLLIGVITVFAFVIGLMTCNRNKETTVLHPTQATIDSAQKAKKAHDHYVDSINQKISRLEKERDSAKQDADKASAALDIKSLEVKALAKQVQHSKKYKDTATYIASCDSLASQVNDLLATVDLYQEENRNVTDSYDSLLGTTSFKIARLEYDYSVLRERFDKVSQRATSLEAANNKLDRKVSKRVIFGIQGGGTYSLQTKAAMPYVGVGFTYKLFAM